jgi:predicted cupin superfamily sugar epimerase
MKSTKTLPAQEVIDRLNLDRLPVEGTFYKNTYVGEIDKLTGNPTSTAIIALYSQTPLSCSFFHKLKHDEMWHFYAGNPIQLHLIHPDGKYQKVILGDSAENVQFVIPKDVWQAGELVPGGAWGLFGCTMSPGFIGSEFTGATALELIKIAPQHKETIERLAVAANHQTKMPADFSQ